MGILRRATRRLLVSMGWATGLGMALVVPSEAATADRQLEELACQRALEANTIEALEEFLLLYPDSDTACTTLALDALNRFKGQGGDSKSGGARGFYGG